MVTRNAPKAILEASRFQERSQGGPASIVLSMIGATWAICAQFWAQLGAKGGPKSWSLAPSRSNIEENDVLERVLKKHENFIEI